VIRHGWKALVIVTLLTLCSLGTVAAQGTTYTDPQGRYSFTVPSGWQAGSPPQGTSLPQGTTIGGVFAAAPPLNGNLNVVTVTVPAGANLDQIVTQSRAGVAQTIPGYQEAPGGIQNLTVGGQSARRYDYLLTPPGSGRLHGAQVIALQGNAVFVLTFTAAENDFNTFMQQAATLLSSFKFLGTGGATATTLPSTGMARGTQWQGTPELLIVLAAGVLIVAGFTLRRRYRPA
jgi:hypothetical protein